MATEDRGSTMERSQRKIMEAVAKYLRFNVPVKPASIKGEKVEYFSGSKAVDSLMESKWTKEPKNPDSDEPYFINRSFAVDYCSKLVKENFFVRAEKIDLKPKSDQAATGEENKSSAIRRRGGDQPSDSPRAKKQGDGSDKKKRKFRLDRHCQQMFVDSKEEVYYWNYDPPSYTTYMIGFAVVVGAIALTLQPLWPDSSRDALWYLSVVVFIVMGFLVLLIVARWIIYGIVLVLTGAKLKFWILPNLDNEKSGFFESFKPFYSIEWAKSKKSKKSKGSKSKDSATEKLAEISNGSGDVSCPVEGKSELEGETPPNGNHKPSEVTDS